MTTAYAPGKVILFGEHAVVYGRPAIAVPVTQVRACAMVEDGPLGQGVIIDATDLHLRHQAGDPVPATSPAYALEATVRNALQRLGIGGLPDLTLTVSSTVPIASGMGSGAAVATAIVRALAQHVGQALSPAEVSQLVYQTEVIHHGTPSGIDNTVIAFEQPVFFVRGKPIETLQVGRPFWLVIGDTGSQSPTKDVVGDVRRAWQAEPEKYEALFDRIGAVATRAGRAIEQGRPSALGELMDENQELLQAIGVSSPQLEKLIHSARTAGAMGAKLCGAGRGGNMIALVARAKAQRVADMLRTAGAVNFVISEVGAASSMSG